MCARWFRVFSAHSHTIHAMVVVKMREKPTDLWVRMVIVQAATQLSRWH